MLHCQGGTHAGPAPRAWNGCPWLGRPAAVGHFQGGFQGQSDHSLCDLVRHGRGPCRSEVQPSLGSSHPWKRDMLSFSETWLQLKQDVFPRPGEGWGACGEPDHAFLSWRRGQVRILEGGYQVVNSVSLVCVFLKLTFMGGCSMFKNIMYNIYIHKVRL